MAPIFCVLTGCGKQKIGATVNLGVFYLAGLPMAVLLAFVFHLNGMVNSTKLNTVICKKNLECSIVKRHDHLSTQRLMMFFSQQGLWLGIVCGSLIKVFLFASVT